MDALSQAGFSQSEVSFVAGDRRGNDTPAIGPTVKDAESEAGSDAVVGALIGLAAGMIAVVLPGIGALIAAGPIAGAIGGMTAGAAAGGVIGLLKDQGIAKEEAEFYAEGLARGGSLVTVHNVDSDREKRAREILDKAGAMGTEEIEEWRASATPNVRKAS